MTTPVKRRALTCWPCARPPDDDSVVASPIEPQSVPIPGNVWLVTIRWDGWRNLRTALLRPPSRMQLPQNPVVASPDRLAGPFRRRRWPRIGAVLLLLAGCDEDLSCAPILGSEDGRLEFFDHAMLAGPCRRLRGPAALLVDTPWCPVLDWSSDRADDPLQVAACFDQEITGATAQDGCVVPTEAGELVWTFSPVDCQAIPEHGQWGNDDAIRLPVVAVDEVFGYLTSPGDAFALRTMTAARGEPFAEAFQTESGEPLHVLAGEPVPLAAVVAHPAWGDVAWKPEQWTLRGTIDDRDVAVEFDELAVAWVTVGAAETLHLWLERGPDTLPLGEVHGVAPSELTSLEVVAGFVGDGNLLPVGARAVAQAGDRLVYGVPVDWTILDGELPLWRDAERAWGADYIALLDEEGRRCHRPPDKRSREFRVRLRAGYGELQAIAEMRWTEDPPDEPSDDGLLDKLGGDDFERSPLCEGPGFPPEGCGCHQGRPDRGSMLAGLALLLLGWRRRALQ